MCPVDGVDKAAEKPRGQNGCSRMRGQTGPGFLVSVS